MRRGQEERTCEGEQICGGEGRRGEPRRGVGPGGLKGREEGRGGGRCRSNEVGSFVRV